MERTMITKDLQVLQAALKADRVTVSLKGKDLMVEAFREPMLMRRYFDADELESVAGDRINFIVIQFADFIRCVESLGGV